jgi:hypothetical protein
MVNKQKIISTIKDVIQVIFVAIILYFFIFGVVTFYQEKIYCDYTQTDYFNALNYNFTIRINENNIKAFANHSGLFDNNIILDNNMHFDNCSFKK